jgi:hypothetical protein
VSPEGKLGMVEWTSARAIALVFGRMKRASRPMNGSGAPDALRAGRFRLVQVAAVAPELRGLQPESVPDWRYNAFELLF